MKQPAARDLQSTPLADLLDRLSDEWVCEDGGVPQRLWERALLTPARDFLSRPGKQFRGRLVTCAWALAGGAPEEIPPVLPLLVEILHAGSLIIDDIQDESDERRGEPTLHRRYGTPVAINTGNWMYYWPLVLIDELELTPATALEVYRRISGTMLRCHQGQALDLSVRVFDLAAREIPRVVHTTTLLKTGSLMELAAALGGLCAGADDDTVAAIACFGRELGCGLQMLDDLGGILAASRRTKGEEDLRLARPTWPWAWVSSTVSEVGFAKLLADARAVHEGDAPEALARSLQGELHTQGPARVRAHLEATFAPMAERFRDHPALADIESEMDRLERAYV